MKITPPYTENRNYKTIVKYNFIMFNFSVRMRSIRISFLLLCALLYTVQVGAVVKGDRFTTKAAQNPGYAGLKFEVTSLQDAWG